MPHSSSGQDRGFLILRYRFESCMRLSCTVRETLASAMCVRLNICPRRLMDRPGGYGPSDARSIRAGDTVTVADMVMQRIVDPPYAGSNPVSHLQSNPSQAHPLRRFYKGKTTALYENAGKPFGLPVFVLYSYRTCSVLFSGRNAYALSKFSLTACHMNNLAT